MRLLFSFLLLGIAIISCKDKKTPDVSKIKINLGTERFERALFAADTSQMEASLDKIASTHPFFTEVFLTQIINIDPQWRADTIASYVKSFVNSYRNVYDSSEQVFPDFSSYEQEIKKSLQYVKYYFPSYKTPEKIVTYIGPLDGYGDILDEPRGIFYIGLHRHLGKNYSGYQASWVQETYPAYISNRFEPSYIAAAAMSGVASAIYPDKTEDKSLVVQMVEKGKRLYLLSKFLPTTPEYKLIGYTEKQLKESYEHEASIWNLFVQNDLLQSIDYNIVKNYIGESPKTAELGEASPGNIGSFAGWQIVKKYMEKFPETSLPAMLQLDAEKLFEDAKYKP